MAGGAGPCEADAFVWSAEVDAVGAGFGFANMDAGKCFFL